MKRRYQCARCGWTKRTTTAPIKVKCGRKNCNGPMIEIHHRDHIQSKLELN